MLYSPRQLQYRNHEWQTGSTVSQSPAFVRFATLRGDTHNDLQVLLSLPLHSSSVACVCVCVGVYSSRG